MKGHEGKEERKVGRGKPRPTVKDATSHPLDSQRHARANEPRSGSP